MQSYKKELIPPDSGFEHICTECGNERCSDSVLNKKYPSGRISGDYVLDCAGHRTIELGVRRLLLTRRACDVTAKVSIGHGDGLQTEEIALFGNGGKKLGVVMCLSEEAEKFRKTDGGIIKFRSKRPVKDERHGNIFFPYTKNDQLEPSFLDSVSDHLFGYDDQYT